MSSSLEGSSHTPTNNTPLTPSETPPLAPQTEQGEATLNAPLPPIPTKRQPVRKPSEVWKHFTKDPVQTGSDVGPRASCNYCHSSYACDPIKNGTSTLMQHLKVQCKGGSPLKEDNKQKVLSFENKGGVVAHAFSKERTRIACAKMIIIDELPFKFVEGPGFKYFMREAQPRFDPPSRRTIARDVWSIFEEEKAKLKSMFSVNSQRVSLTTDTWTSIQNVNYMALTVHFIDDGWNLHKRILNFCQITNHKGEAIGRLIEKCLTDWGIEKVFSITVDNASANDGAVKYIKSQLTDWNTLLCDGEMLHMRCCAHITNLIVFDGVSELHDSIKSIRKACRYTRSSPSRLEKFRQCLFLAKIDSKGLLPLECKTRWNSTYLMLDAALKLQKGFERLALEDSNFEAYFNEVDKDEMPKEKKRKFGGEASFKTRVRPPTVGDWHYARAFVTFLKRFYEATLKFSASKMVTANIPFHEMAKIVHELNRMMQSRDPFMKRVATSMKKKYDKYWGQIGGVNQLIILAVILDPRYKIDYVHFSLPFLEVDESKVDETVVEVKKLLMRLYEEYKKENPSLSQSYVEEIKESGLDESVEIDPMLEQFMKSRKDKDVVQIENEVDKYLLEPAENPKNVGFNLLGWWKEHSPRFPIMSKVAKDIFAVPVSSVPSESAFSAGKRVVDPFRACLTPKTVEALICTNDWLRGEDFDFNKEPTEDDLELYLTLEKLEKEVESFQSKGQPPPSDTDTLISTD